MDKTDIGALWAKTSAKGTEFLAGRISIEGVAHEIVLFKNTYKKAPNQPDWRIYASKPRGESSAPADESPF